MPCPHMPAIHKDAMLENVALKERGGKLVPDYFDTSKTENGRVSYPITHIDNYVSFAHCSNSNLFFFVLNFAFTLPTRCIHPFIVRNLHSTSHRWQDIQRTSSS